LDIGVEHKNAVQEEPRRRKRLDDERRASAKRSVAGAESLVRCPDIQISPRG